MKHRIPQNIPFGTTTASVKANRNLLYLAGKGVIPSQPMSARVAHEITSDNIAKEARREVVAFARQSKDAIGAIVNEICSFRLLELASNNRFRRLNIWQ